MDSVLEKQIEETMKKAFWDLIKSDLDKEPQSFDHLIKLIIEIKERMKMFTPRRTNLHKEFDEVLDDEFLKHLFTEKSLDPNHFFRLIQFLITKVKMYAAPYLDKDIIEWEQTTLEKMKQTIVYKDFLPFFFENLYKFIEIIENDIKTFYSKKDS